MLTTFKKFYSFQLKYKWRFVLFVITVLFLGIANNIQPYFFKLFVDAAPKAELNVLLKILWMYVGFRFLEILLDLLAYYTADFVLIPSGRDARLAIFKKIQDLDMSFHISKSTGSLISAIKRGDGSYWGMFHNINLQIIRIVIGFFVMLFLFSKIKIEIALITGVSFALNSLFIKKLIENNIKTRADFNKEEDKISAIIVDNLINFETVKLFAKEKREFKRLKNTFKVWYKKLWGYSNSFRIIDIVIGTSGNLGLFVVLLYSIFQTSKGVFTPGDLILIITFSATFYGRFFDLLYRLRDIAKNYSDIEKYFSILDNKVAVKDPIKPLEINEVQGEIFFNKISFSYPDTRKNALRNFSLKIRGGQSVAFVGQSGAGKTTIIKLLMRFYDPKTGSIEIDGRDIKLYTKDRLRSFMGVVPQEPTLFNDTIAFNIGYGLDKPNKNEIEAAAKMANLDDFINSLPKGYKTIVGERGVKLSGGQKQRLAIARMILSNPDIVIFDEATSHLDSETEKKIQDAFWKASVNKTTLIIAHRLSTVMKADKIVVMDKGKVKEIGTHKILIKNKNSLYRRYWKIQVNSLYD